MFSVAKEIKSEADSRRYVLQRCVIDEGVSLGRRGVRGIAQVCHLAVDVRRPADWLIPPLEVERQAQRYLAIVLRVFRLSK